MNIFFRQGEANPRHSDGHCEEQAPSEQILQLVHLGRRLQLLQLDGSARRQDHEPGGARLLTSRGQGGHRTFGSRGRSPHQTGSCGVPSAPPQPLQGRFQRPATLHSAGVAPSVNDTSRHHAPATRHFMGVKRYHARVTRHFTKVTRYFPGVTRYHGGVKRHFSGVTRHRPKVKCHHGRVRRCCGAVTCHQRRVTRHPQAAKRRLGAATPWNALPTRHFPRPPRLSPKPCPRAHDATSLSPRRAVVTPAGRGLQLPGKRSTVYVTPLILPQIGI